MYAIKVNIYLTYYTVDVIDPKLINVIHDITRNLTSYIFEYNKFRRKMIRKIGKRYYILNYRTRVARLPIATLNTLYDNLRDSFVDESEILTIDHRTTNSDYDLVGASFNNELKPRPYQVKYINAMLSDKLPILLIDLQTGKGKTFIGMSAIMKINKRFGIIILPKYIDKWILDVKKYTNITDEQVFIVQGSDSLIELMNMDKDEVSKYQVFIFAMRTIQGYLDMFIQDDEIGQTKFPIHPEDLFDHLRIHTLLSDESHQEFHCLFTAMLYFRPKKFIGLSATLNSHDPRVKSLQNILFPQKTRINNIIPYDKYIVYYDYKYNISHPVRVRCTRRNAYSHLAFEQYMLANSIFREDYSNMILSFVNEHYVSRMREGDKLLIFCSTVNYCKFLARYLKSNIEKKLDIRTYIETDDYSNLMDADICVSTVLSSGTAVDIPNLITVIQTITIASLQANQQALGRLRKIENMETRYINVSSWDLPKHIQIGHKREEAIGDLVKNKLYYTYSKTINNV